MPILVIGKIAYILNLSTIFRFLNEWETYLEFEILDGFRPFHQAELTVSRCFLSGVERDAVNYFSDGVILAHGLTRMMVRGSFLKTVKSLFDDFLKL